MENLGLLLFKSAAWLTGFALVYLLLLRNERYFQLNRIFLLTGIVASLLFPFYTFHYNVVVPSNLTESASVGLLSEGVVVPDEPAALPFYFWIYLVGIAAFLLRLLFQTWRIIRKLRKSGYEQAGTVKLVRTAEYASSFSFFSFVFVNPSTANIEMEEIINHEREHIQQRHWFDLLLVELICIVQWFNPFAWIYTHLVRQNHEYLADESALQRTANPAIYQATLLNQLLGAPVFSLTNSFSYSLNKKRFKMMKKKIDSPFRKLKMLFVLPLAAMLFYAFAVPEYQYGNENSSVSPEGKTMDVKGQVLKSDGSPLPGTTVILKGSTIGTISDPQGNFILKGIPSDGELVFSFVGLTTKVQKVSDQPMKVVLETAKVGLDQVTVVGYGTPPLPPPPPPPPLPGKLYDTKNPPLYFLDGVELTKDEMGKINPSDIHSMSVLKDKNATDLYGDKGKNGVILITTKQAVIKGIDPAKRLLYIIDGVEADQQTAVKLNPSTLGNISVLKDPNLIAPYGEKGKNGVILIFTKEFSRNNPDKVNEAKRKIVKPAQREDGVYVVVEQMPQFPGGESALRQFIMENIKYPAEAKQKGIQGRVFVSFVVNSKGKVERAKVVRGVDPLLDQEALRVVSLLPDWTPGKVKGEAVDVSYTIPVQFKLSDNKDAASRQSKGAAPAGKEVFVVVEQMPEFPGGSYALRTFIAREVRYPVEAQKNKTQGKVFVSFVVNSTGKVEQAKIEQSVDPLLDAEAIRVINLMPDWKPGKQRGQAVNVAYTVPIEFKLK